MPDQRTAVPVAGADVPASAHDDAARAEGAAGVARPDGEGGDVAGLIARVRERGFVTTGEIFAALPDLEPETAELAAIYERISLLGIQGVGEIAEELEREDQRRAGSYPAAISTRDHDGGSHASSTTGSIDPAPRER